MRLRLEARGEKSTAMVYLSPLMALGLTLIGGAALFEALGAPPGPALYAFFIRPVDTLYGLGELGVKATPLALIAIGLAVGFRGNVWNIGAEGQLTLGALSAGAVALAFYEREGWYILPLMAVGGVVGGAAWAAIPAWLRTRFNANEILVSLMLTYVAILLLSYMVNGPLRDPDGYNFPESRLFSDSALLGLLLPETRLHTGALFALAAVAGGYVLMMRTFVGFQIKVVGMTPQAADYAGFDRKLVIWLSLMIGGGLAGLAGMVEVAGPIGQLLPSVSPGYGFAAIIVAFLGRLHAVGILLASLLMALVYLGGETVQMEMGLPVAVTGVFQGMLLFFLLAADVLIRYRLRWAGARGGEVG